MGQLSTKRIVDAVVLAAEENRESHPAERWHASQLKEHPQIMEARLGRVRYVCGRLGVGPGSVLLDVGSGIGVNSVLALLCGAKEVHAVEMTPDRLESAKIIARYLGVEDRLHIHGQDVLTLQLPAGSVDAAFSFELLEHVRDIGSLYSKLARWVKEGARVYGRTGANGWNPYRRWRFRKIWAKCDRENYVADREKLIRSLVPGAPPEDVEILVDRTRGEMLDTIRSVALEYARVRALPARRRPRAPRDPKTGQYMDRLLDPLQTMTAMDAAGFSTTLLRPCFKNVTTVNALVAMGQKLVGNVIRGGHPVSLPLAPWLEFLSTRRPLPRAG